ANWFLFFGVVIVVAILFASLGIITGIMAEKFDHLAVTTTFFITPLVFVGGVFTSTQFLPPVARALSLFNPMFHMIDALRYAYTGLGDAPLWISLVVVCVLAAISFTAAYRMAAT